VYRESYKRCRYNPYNVIFVESGIMVVLVVHTIVGRDGCKCIKHEEGKILLYCSNFTYKLADYILFVPSHFF
ncbi:hypothetical protein EUTSA_v10015582mg, partial [Eutrema salsugineum]